MTEAAAAEERVRRAFATQAQWARRLASPLTALVCDVAAAGLDRTNPVGRRVLSWPGPPEPEADALALRLAGGLHALARRGTVPELAACYPPHPLPTADRLGRAIDAVLREAGDELETWLERAPQTNEVGRAAVLMSGLLVLARRHDRPLSLFELGASAGLNLMLDRYFYRLGTTAAGDPTAALQLAPEWTGAPPPAAEVRIASRRAVDLNPLDVRREADRERLFAFVWPDHGWRLEQLDRALRVCRDDPPRVERGAAGEWLEAALAAAPPEPAVRVVMHSLAFQYFPADEQRRVAGSIEAHGARAAADAPLAWLRFEIDPQDGRPSLRLRIWPGGEDRLLAFAHPHGRSVQWLHPG